MGLKAMVEIFVALEASDSGRLHLRFGFSDCGCMGLCEAPQNYLK